MARSYNRILLLSWAISLLAPFQNASAQSILGQFFDPEDGQFDTSQFLASKVDFLPVPIIITEPAVGYGAGIALAFFHEPDEPAPIDDPNAPFHLPPSISIAAYGQTENGSKFAGLGHLGSFKQDRIRYTGALDWGTLNLTVFPVADRGIDFNIEGLIVIQELLFQLAQPGLFVGGQYNYSSNSTDFELPVDLGAADSGNAGLGFALHYDSRDNMVSPNGGQLFKFEPTFMTQL